MEKHIQVVMEKCTGCRMCELACSLEKASEFNPRKSLIKVTLVGMPEIPVPLLLDTCDYCQGDPECVKFCAPEALLWKEMKQAPVRPPVSRAKDIAEAWFASVNR